MAGRTDSVVDTNYNKTQSITEERQRTNLHQAYGTYGAKLICERRVGQRDPVPLELEEEEEDRLRNTSAFHELQVFRASPRRPRRQTSSCLNLLGS